MPLDNEELRERLSRQQWTAHNIRLTEELETLPGTPDFLQTDQRLHAVLRSLSVFYRDDFASLRIADLGCLEGGFSLALAQLGASVLGIEARELNVTKANLLQQHFALPNLSFARADVKDFDKDRFGIFDVVLALGILYHLDNPLTWMPQIADATRAVLFVDSHFAPADDAAMAAIDPRLAQLGPIETVDHDGRSYEGRWFFEYPPETDPEPQLWASYSNHQSFWLTKESLLLGLLQAGFDLVFEQHDYSVTSYKHLSLKFPRVMCMAVKSMAFQQPLSLARHEDGTA
jgi:SAM-dependent methyltransferase